MSEDLTALPDRFWSKVDRSSGDCWIWTAQLNEKGYGVLRWMGRPRRAHRLVCQYVLNRQVEGLQVDHTCHQRACVNPAHLQVVTGQANQENRAGANRNSRSGARGVSWSEQRGKWYVRVICQGRSYGGGFFDDPTEAERAAVALRNQVMTNNLADRRSA